VVGATQGKMFLDIRKHAPPREDGAPASLEDAFLAITEEHMKKGGET